MLGLHYTSSTTCFRKPFMYNIFNTQIRTNKQLFRQPKSISNSYEFFLQKKNSISSYSSFALPFSPFKLTRPSIICYKLFDIWTGFSAMNIIIVTNIVTLFLVVCAKKVLLQINYIKNISTQFNWWLRSLVLCPRTKHK